MTKSVPKTTTKIEPKKAGNRPASYLGVALTFQFDIVGDMSVDLFR